MHSRCRSLAVSAWAMISLGLAAGPSMAQAAPGEDDRWHFKITPYAWFPAVDASFDATVPGLPRLGGGEPARLSVSGSVNPDDYLSDLQFAFMVSAEARKGPWAILTDVVYAALGSQDTRVRSVTGPLGRVSGGLVTDATLDVSSTLWTFGGGYRVVENQSVSADVIAGVRYLDAINDLKVVLSDERGRPLVARKGSLDQQVWDGLVGFRGELRFSGSQWFVPFYGDIGAGDSNWTWQALLGVGYRFDWGDALVAWRAIGYDFDEDNLDLTFNGPAVGVSFAW